MRPFRRRYAIRIVFCTKSLIFHFLDHSVVWNVVIFQCFVDINERPTHSLALPPSWRWYESLSEREGRYGFWTIDFSPGSLTFFISSMVDAKPRCVFRSSSDALNGFYYSIRPYEAARLSNVRNWWHIRENNAILMVYWLQRANRNRPV